MLKRIVYDDVQKVVVDILENDNSVTATYLPVLVETLENAMEVLLYRGINVRLIEDQLGIDPSMLAGFHSEWISDLEDGTKRLIDVVMMPVTPIFKSPTTGMFGKFTLVTKVKYYDQFENYLGYMERPDKVVVLSAEDYEWQYFYDLMKNQRAYMWDLFPQFIQLRASEGRFD